MGRKRTIALERGPQDEGILEMIKAKVLLAAITAPVTIAVLAFAAQGAQASTSACTRGAYSGYCGTQANNATTDLVLDSAGQKTTTNNKVIGWPNSTSDPTVSSSPSAATRPTG